jgi:hypothetical protein
MAWIDGRLVAATPLALRVKRGNRNTPAENARASL